MQYSGVRGLLYWPCSYLCVICQWTCLHRNHLCSAVQLRIFGRFHSKLLHSGARQTAACVCVCQKNCVLQVFTNLGRISCRHLDISSIPASVRWRPNTRSIELHFKRKPHHHTLCWLNYDRPIFLPMPKSSIQLLRKPRHRAW